jgi:hypothetical protein
MFHTDVGQDVGMTDAGVPRALWHALIAEATKKAAVVWLSVDDAPAYGVWCLPLTGALYVVTGPGEQPAPGLAEAGTVRVRARGEHGGQIVSWLATVERVPPGSDDWDELARQLAGKRLNATGTVEAVVARWARECTVLRLVSTEDGVEAGATAKTCSQAAPPRPTPAIRSIASSS